MKMGFGDFEIFRKDGKENQNDAGNNHSINLGTSFSGLYVSSHPVLGRNGQLFSYCSEEPFGGNCNFV